MIASMMIYLIVSGSAGDAILCKKLINGEVTESALAILKPYQTETTITFFVSPYQIKSDLSFDCKVRNDYKN